MTESMLFPFIDEAMRMIALALIVGVPMLLITPANLRQFARYSRRRARSANE